MSGGLRPRHSFSTCVYVSSTVDVLSPSCSAISAIENRCSAMRSDAQVWRRSYGRLLGSPTFSADGTYIRRRHVR